jgi:hypothetical protein
VALSTNLISYWSMEEASGNAQDAHGSNHLTDNGGTGSAAGKVGNARDLEAASSQYFSLADNPSISTGDIDFTFACWINAESLAGNQRIINKINQAVSVLEFQLFSQSGTQLLWEVFNGSSAIGSIGTSTALSTGTWYFVVCWHDSVNNLVGISVNAGTAVTTATSGAPANTTAPFSIGSLDGLGTTHWDGLIDEVAFWKRVLTSAERTELYNSGNGRAYSYIGASMTLDRALVLNGSGTVTVGLTGTGTSWTGTPFSLTATPTGWSIASQNVISATSATVTLNRGSGTGTLTISDGTNSDSLTVTDTATTVGTGNWATAATWDTDEAPGNGHKASVGHAVTVAANATIGTSPSNTTTIVLSIGANITVNPGVTFTVRGNAEITANATALQVGTAGGGATLEFDASQAGTPGTNYKLRLGTSNGAHPTATLRTRGTSGSRSAVRSNSGGGNFQVVADVNGCGTLDLQFCDFLRVGTSALDAFDMDAAGGSIAIADCTFDACGELGLGNALSGGYVFTVADSLWSNTVAADYCIRMAGGTAGAGAKTVSGCAFDAPIRLSLGAVTLSDSVITGGSDDTGSGYTLEVANCVYLTDDVSTGAFTLSGDYTDCYFYAGGNGNPHFPILSTDGATPTTVEGCIVEYGGDFVTAGGDGGNAFYGTGDWTLVNCITLPAGEHPELGSGAVTPLANQTVSLIHCTLYSPEYTGGILLGDGGASTGMVPECKSNLFWAKLSEPDGLAAYSLGTVIDNQITPAGCTHNGLVNIQNPAYEGLFTTTQPGANDVRLDATNEATVFVDASRSLATWAVSRGSVSGTYAGKVADAKAYLLADPTLIGNLLTHVRTGFAPKAVALRDAGHDAVTIGAVEYQASGGGSLVNGGLINSGLINGGLIR